MKELADNTTDLWYWLSTTGQLTVANIYHNRGFDGSQRRVSPMWGWGFDTDNYDANGDYYDQHRRDDCLGTAISRVRDGLDEAKLRSAMARHGRRWRGTISRDSREARNDNA